MLMRVHHRQRCSAAVWEWDAVVTQHGWQGSNAVAHIMLPGKGFSLTHAADKLIAATSTRHLLVYDIGGAWRFIHGAHVRAAGLAIAPGCESI